MIYYLRERKEIGHMPALLFGWSHMTQLDKVQPATKRICDGSLFNDAYAAGCVIDLS